MGLSFYCLIDTVHSPDFKCFQTCFGQSHRIFGATPTCEVDATTTADTGPALVTEIHGQG